MQEPIGFSPSELVFTHSVYDPLKLLREKWLGETEPPEFVGLVCGFRFKLHRACELAKDNLLAVQKKMKGWYDQKTESRVFSLVTKFWFYY